MGAIDDTESFEAPNEKAALKKANEVMENLRHERGHGYYAGHVGTASGVTVYRVRNPLTMDQAEELLFGDEQWQSGDGGRRPLCEKAGPAILVRVRNTGSRKARWILGATVGC